MRSLEDFLNGRFIWHWWQKYEIIVYIVGQRLQIACKQVASVGDGLCFRGVKGSQKVMKHGTLKGHSQRAMVYQGI